MVYESRGNNKEGTGRKGESVVIVCISYLEELCILLLILGHHSFRLVEPHLVVLPQLGVVFHQHLLLFHGLNDRGRLARTPSADLQDREEYSNFYQRWR